MNSLTGWFISASEPKYQVDIDGSIVFVSLGQLNQIIKEKLSNSPVVHKLFEQFEVDIAKLNDLRIEVDDLDDRYAETDLEKMSLNQSLFDGGHFLQDYFFIVLHEIVHWLSRTKESVAHEIEQNTNPNEIWNKVYGKVSFHFNNEEDARAFFENIIEKAMDLLNS
jgi:hypothetical protein